MTMVLYSEEKKHTIYIYITCLTQHILQRCNHILIVIVYTYIL